LSILTNILFFLNLLVIGYFLFINTAYLFLSIASYFHIRKYKDIDRVFKMTGVYSTNLYKPVSIIAPAYNEEGSIINSVNSLLNIKYSNFEVVVVNDGSKDKTLQLMIDYFKLEKDERHRPKYVDHKPIKAIYRSDRYPKLIVVDKENGRKADALNAGINIASKDLICAVDSDSILEADVIIKMLRVFMEDESTIAVGGVIRVANGCTFRNREIVAVSLWFGIINVLFATLFVIASIVFGMILSVFAVLLEELTTRRYQRIGDILMLILFALLENIGFRQMHSWWRLKGLVDYLKGSKEWGEMVRKGIG